jgi:hypothetical protein
MISEKIYRWLSNEENLVRILRYWWIISTLRIVIGTSILILILLGYTFSHYKP